MFTKQNIRRREEITTRRLAMINSRRGEPYALFITFYLINRKKPLIQNITRLKVYILSFMQARFIRIHTMLYLYPCFFILTSIVKNDSSFYGSSSCYNDNKIKMKEKNRKGKTYFHLERFDPDRPSDVPKDVTTRLQKLFRMYIQSNLTISNSVNSKSPLFRRKIECPWIYPSPLHFPGYFEAPLFRTVFHFPWDFEIARFDCTWCEKFFCKQN